VCPDPFCCHAVSFDAFILGCLSVGSGGVATAGSIDLFHVSKSHSLVHDNLTSSVKFSSSVSSVSWLMIRPIRSSII